MYEKGIGLYCIGCEPLGAELQNIRNERAEKKAVKLLSSAAKLDKKAEEKQAEFNRLRGDIAFITQPGHVHGRDRIIRAYDKGLEIQQEAKRKRERAEGLLAGSSHIAGDAEVKRQALRDSIRPRLSVGQMIETWHFGRVTVKKINRKTVIVKSECFDSLTTDISFIVPESLGI